MFCNSQLSSPHSSLHPSSAHCTSNLRCCSRRQEAQQRRPQKCFITSPSDTPSTLPKLFWLHAAPRLDWLHRARTPDSPRRVVSSRRLRGVLSVSRPSSNCYALRSRRFRPAATQNCKRQGLKCAFKVTSEEAYVSLPSVNVMGALHKTGRGLLIAGWRKTNEQEFLTRVLLRPKQSYMTNSNKTENI